MSNQRPKRGSGAFRPRKRYKKFFFGVRTLPSASSLSLGCVLAKKLGNKTSELFLKNSSETILTNSTLLGLQTFSVIGYVLYARDKLFLQKKVLKKVFFSKEKLEPEKKKQLYSKASELKALVQITIKRAYEIPLLGEGTIEEKVLFLKKLSQTTPASIFSEFEYLDVESLTKGKGFQGPIKRYSVKRLSHKNSKKRRAIATQGGKTPKHTRPTVGAAGQLGFFKRTEYNKLYLTTLPKEEFSNKVLKGVSLKNIHSILVVEGSVPGTRNRLVWLKKSLRKPFQVKENFKTSKVIW